MRKLKCVLLSISTLLLISSTAYSERKRLGGKSKKMACRAKIIRKTSISLNCIVKKPRTTDGRDRYILSYHGRIKRGFIRLRANDKRGTRFKMRLRYKNNVVTVKMNLVRLKRKYSLTLNPL